MPHKYVTADVIERLEREINEAKSSIDRIKLFSRFDKDSWKVFSEQISDFVTAARTRKDMALDGALTNTRGDILPAEIQARAALVCRGQEKAFEIVMEMLTDPNKAVSFYNDTIQQAQEDLKLYARYEQRPAPTTPS